MEKNAYGNKPRPLGWKPSLLIFLVTAMILRVTHYLFIPTYTSKIGNPYLIGYLIGWVGSMFLVFAVSLAAYRLERNPLQWRAFRSRYRLERMDKNDWVWFFGAFVFAVVSAFALSFTQSWLSSIPLTAPHPEFPLDFVNPANFKPGFLFEMPLKRAWWIIGVYFLGWFFNIFGEEFWYRGWMLPRQELAFGKFAWLVNGLMFNFQHLYMPWTLISMLPGSLFVAYVVQRRKNTRISILFHGILNIIPLFMVFQGVIW